MQLTCYRNEFSGKILIISRKVTSKNISEKMNHATDRRTKMQITTFPFTKTLENICWDSNSVLSHTQVWEQKKAWRALIHISTDNNDVTVKCPFSIFTPSASSREVFHAELHELSLVEFWYLCSKDVKRYSILRVAYLVNSTLLSIGGTREKEEIIIIRYRHYLPVSISLLLRFFNFVQFITQRQTKNTRTCIFILVVERREREKKYKRLLWNWKERVSFEKKIM